ncbi:hypothetical protein CDAR_35521 [Caerostris darwini]|uniref:Uncharacterized protein n=1 Tax=Caerostris darwini TaxID=1538125 RepID=A0AAV4SLM7_9ARAC|nr:hypothetical protein CDAR_35521 [Caerostris darwini]
MKHGLAEGQRGHCLSRELSLAALKSGEGELSAWALSSETRLRPKANIAKSRRFACGLDKQRCHFLSEITTFSERQESCGVFRGTLMTSKLQHWRDWNRIQLRNRVCAKRRLEQLEFGLLPSETKNRKCLFKVDSKFAIDK